MDKYLIKTAEDWIQIANLNLSQCKDETSPFYFLLVDYQERILEDKICTYKRTVEKVNDASRIEDASLFMFELQEKNHQIIFHTIDIIRNGERFSALDNEKISINQREKSLENHVTDHRQTVSISIDDLRAGDIIDYSATDIVIAGEHPLNGKHYHATFWLNWNCPVYLQMIRIVNQSNKIIHVQTCSIEKGVHSSNTIDIKPNETFEKSYKDLPSMPIEDVAPTWLWSNFLLAATHSKWDELSVYLYNYYTSQGLLDSNINFKNDLPGLNLSGDRAIDIIIIVRFVQNEIRYKGENFGIHTHSPKKPGHTLSKRYGDCKDKSNLLVALLKSLDIKASLTLVNTEYGIKIKQLSPSPYHFNHMIVHVEYEGMSYYFDPTIKKQAGNLENCAFLDYGYGLILSEQGTSLQKLPYHLDQEVYKLNHVFNFSNQNKVENSLTIYRIYFRHRADNMRYYLQSTENMKLEKDFLRYAKEETDLDLTVEKAITSVEDDEQLNMFKTEEKYLINNLNIGADQLLQLLTTFYLEFPSTTNMDFPLRIDLDGSVSHDIEIIYNKAPLQSSENKAIENNWFYYQDSIFKRENSLYMSASVTPKRRHVESKDINSYLDDVEKMRLRSMNNFPYVYGNVSSFNNIGRWMIYSGGIILYIMLMVLFK